MAEVETPAPGGPVESFEGTINGMPIVIDPKTGRYTMFGIPSVAFWLNPSMYRMLAPLIKETGVEMARLLIAYESSQGAEIDYSTIVSKIGPTFELGFLGWGRSVSTVGWGSFELPLFDRPSQRAVVRVRNAWELIAQAGNPVRWGCPFLKGKIIGIFRHALGANCWADEHIVDEAAHIVEFSVHPSERTIAGEIELLRRAQHEKKQAELQALERQLQEKQQMIFQLSTPVVRLWEGILLLPLVGHIDGQRANQLTQNVLAAVTESRATALIIDITGVPFVDSSVANSLVRTVQASKLLGVESLLVGISSEVAQTLVRLGADLGRVRTFSTLESGLNHALSQQKFQIVKTEAGKPPRR